MKFPLCWSLSLLLSFSLIVNGQAVNEDIEDFLALSCNQPVVTLHVYSAGENPTWKLNITQIMNVKTVVSRMMKGYDNQTLSNKSSTRVMGYQGFSVSCSVDKEIFIQGLAQIEKQLLDSGRLYLPTSVFQHVSEHLGQAMPVINYRKLNGFHCDRVPIKGPDSVPAYNPQTDNGGCFITRQTRNNCYAYATDIVTNTFPQPGRYSGMTAPSVTCESVRKASIRDGLVYHGTTLRTAHPRVGHYAALFIWPNRDYHWIRKDANGFWSHKPGAAAVTNRDNKGSFIGNPLASNFSPWTIFCGYYIAQPSKVHIH